MKIELTVLHKSRQHQKEHEYKELILLSWYLSNKKNRFHVIRSSIPTTIEIKQNMAMPNIPGDKLSADFVKIRPDLPVLLCTGFSEKLTEERAAFLGIKGFLLKPIVMKDLSQKIREVLDKNKS